MTRGRKVENLVFICLMSVLMCSLLATVVLIKTGVVPKNDVKLGNEETAETVGGNGFLAAYYNLFEQYRVRITNYASKQFPGNIPLLEANTRLRAGLSAALYGALFGDARFVPLKLSSGVRIFADREYGRLIHVPSATASQASLESAAAVVNGVARRHPELNVGVYLVPEPFLAGVMHKESKLFPDWPNRVEEGLALLDDSVSAGWLEYRSIAEYDKYIFKTDHHWNFTGAYRGYGDIVSLMGRKNPSMGGPLPMLGTREVPEDFYGSYARMAAFSQYHDKLTDGVFDRPEPAVWLSGATGPKPTETYYANRTAYLAGTRAAPKYTNMYADYFRNDYALIRFECGTATGRKLLVLADSISNCMDDLLAAHYDTTYSADLRAYKQFDFERFVADNGVTDVLFLYTGAFFSLGDYAARFSAGQGE